MAARLRLNEMTREQIAEIAPHSTVILPTAATEQHGPHLPILTDSLACETIALRAAERAANSIAITVAPLLPYGSSHHHLDFPGVMSLSGELFTRAVYGLCESLTRSGFRRLFVLNGHGGNDEAIRVVAREIALNTDATIGAASYWTIARQVLEQEGNVGAVGPLPGHAGGFETSLILALRPELVDSERMPPADDRTALEETGFLASRAYVQRPGRWKAVRGYSDCPDRATAEHGDRFLDLIVREVAETFIRFHESIA